MIRFDRVTLKPFGYFVSIGSHHPVDETKAYEIAHQYLSNKLDHPWGGPQLTKTSLVQSEAGIHHFGGFAHSEGGGFVFVSGLTGKIFVGGLISEQGFGSKPLPLDTYWLPEQWESPDPLKPSGTMVKPSAIFLDPLGKPGPGPSEYLNFTSKDAMDAALKLNLAYDFARGHHDQR